MKQSSRFEGRKLVIATKHEKEKVIAPILEKELGVVCSIIPDFDTDVLGTFSGEVERIADPITTARKKCELAMDIGQFDLAIASEGSFGPHPTLIFVPADDEILLLMDRRNDLQIVVRELSTDTNFNGAEIRSRQELDLFLEKAKFPSHGIILKKEKDDVSNVVKGVLTEEELDRYYQGFMRDWGKCYVETDMRAMCNPSRMEVIKKATIKLVKKVNSLCPQCQTPGFGVTDFATGLPCGLCGSPTKSILSHIYRCNKCEFTKSENFPFGKLIEDPMYCDFCNP